MHFNIDNFVAGWIGGVCGLVVGHPLDTIKVRQQAFGSSFRTAAGRTFRHEGFFGFFKGMLFPLVTIGPSNALLFGVYGNMLQALGPTPRHIPYNDTESIKRVFHAGLVAGFFQAIFSCPIEFVKTIIQVKTEGKGSWKKHYEVKYHGSIEAFVGILKEQGFKALFRGLTPMLIRDVPTSGLYVLTYEMLMRCSFFECETPVVIKRTIAGGTAGLTSWLFVFPFDVVKVRMQTDNPYKPVYKGMVDCFKKSYKEAGLPIFFKGFSATMLRTFPVNAAVFVSYETVLNSSWHVMS